MGDDLDTRRNRLKLRGTLGGIEIYKLGNRISELGNYSTSYEPYILYRTIENGTRGKCK